MGNSPDTAPMDYGVNGDYKQRLWRHRVHTVEGLKRVMNLEWKRTSITFIRKTLDSWHGRVVLIEKNKGYHIEQKRKKEKNFSTRNKDRIKTWPNLTGPPSVLILLR